MFQVTWAQYKSFIDSRGRKAQFIEDATTYLLYAEDGRFILNCTILKTDPVNADQTDFETNYKAKGNKPQELKSTEGYTVYEPGLRTGLPGTKSLSMCTPDFTDRTSWYQKSLRVTDEVATDSGDGLRFNSVNPWWIDMDSPTSKCTYTYKQIPKIDGTYGQHSDWCVTVKVDDVVVLREESNGTVNYTVNYRDGYVTFAASRTGQVVKVTYSHTSGVTSPSEWLLVPPAGKKYMIQHVELQFSKPITLTNTMRFEIWAGGASVAAYGNFSSGLFNAGYGQLRADYRNIRDFVNASNEGKGTIPAVGDLTQEVLVFPFHYVQAIVLSSLMNVVFRVHCLKDIEHTGAELATGTFYLVVAPA